ncbi:D-isomer specific 2-hydroxyacid dehydrogenase family protein [Streptomyces justiciae]|uniref:D-isomer specific 2-hydroxyacid dehydrogenase family protein n=1 Tax=Streptomyces justiciae TaxID=2780140 RepID=A0ABU3LKJ0_9ACTN|nr:D-isomer specific 2-hydroxyacid dehydrogenase family protein [Streptomyces justiciae]MDT7839754.1 D-isomer specific 2-hydroxyacid dehydrogenase family protein [Streptomyces justiciae]
MTHSETTRITVYGCGPDEAVLFRELAPGLGVQPALATEPVSEANTELASGSRCISVGHKTPVTHATLRALDRVGVRYISTRSVGCNHIDVEYAAGLGILVENVSYSPDSVADYTLMLLLMALRDAKSMVRRTDLHDYRLSDVRGRELRDLTVGVIGTGRIGAAVMGRLRGFGCRLLAHDNRPVNRPGSGVEYVPLDQLLRRSDVVTLHAPLTTATHHLLNRQRLAQMKDDALIVNTGRGALIDTEALVQELEIGRLGGVALDVVEGEEGVFYSDCRDKPLESKALLRLQELPNAVISPHTAYYTDRALRDAVENSLTNCLTFESRIQHG